MSMPRACLVCGKRTTLGSRCAQHAGQQYATPTSCTVCGRRSAKSYCPEHDPFAEGLSEEQRQARQWWRQGYSLPSYRRARTAARRRARGYCERCGRQAERLEADHIVPLSKAATIADLDRLNVPENLAMLCIPCHQKKTAKR